ncbi:MAG: copper chaperone PCu(A)C [Marinicellaceae bacterium]
MKLNLKIKNLCQLFLLILISNSVYSQSNLPSVNDQWLRAAPPNAMMQAAYAEISNTTGKDIKLIDAYSPAFNMTEIHKTVITDGIARMVHQPELIIKNNEKLLFKPLGLHIMLMHPIIDFTVGDSIKINLIYLMDDKRVVDEIWFPVVKK